MYIDSGHSLVMTMWLKIYIHIVILLFFLMYLSIFVSTYFDVCNIDCSISQMISNTMYFLRIASDVIGNEMDLFRIMMYISLYYINDS